MMGVRVSASKPRTHLWDIIAPNSKQLPEIAFLVIVAPERQTLMSKVTSGGEYDWQTFLCHCLISGQIAVLTAESPQEWLDAGCAMPVVLLYGTANLLLSLKLNTVKASRSSVNTHRRQCFE